MRDGAGPQIAITVPGGTHTTLNPASSQTTNQAAINAAGAGAVIWWPAGRYYLDLSTAYTPLNGQTWYLETPARGIKKTESNTAVLTKGQIVTGWTAGTGADTGLWWVGGQTQDFGDDVPRVGTAADGINPLFYTEREDYWLDKDEMGPGTANTATLLFPVADKDDLFGGSGIAPVGKGRYFDHAADVVWIGFNPAGHTIHRTVGVGGVNGVIIGTTSGTVVKGNITILGGIFEMALGVIYSMSYGEGLEHDLTIEHATLRYCHGLPITAWGDFETTIPGTFVNIPGPYTIRNCYIGWGGKYAFVAQRIGDLTFDYNEVEYGNFGPSGVHGIDDEGMQKLGNIVGFQTFNYNWVHNNNSSVWWDTRADNLEMRENVIENNPMGYGVMLEDVATTPILFSRNYLKDNGHPHPWFLCATHGFGNYHNPTFSYDRTSGHMRTNATDGLEISYNWFIDTLDATDVLQTHDIEFNFQSRSTGDGPVNTWNHHNRYERRVRLNTGVFQYNIYKAFSTTDWGASHAGHRTIDNNKWDFNEYHVKAGFASTADWFHRGGQMTWTTWRAGAFAQTGLAGDAPASHYDPNSTITADL